MPEEDAREHTKHTCTAEKAYTIYRVIYRIWMPMRHVHTLSTVPTSLSSAQELHKFAGQGELNSQRLFLLNGPLTTDYPLLTTPTPTC